MLEEHRLLGRAAPDERIHDHDAAIDTRLAPEVEAAGCSEIVAGVEMAHDLAFAELAKRNVERERHQSVELALQQRRIDKRGHGGLDGAKIVDKQVLRILACDRQALARRADMAIADRPTAVRKPDSRFAQSLERLDQFEASG